MNQFVISFLSENKGIFFAALMVISCSLTVMGIWLALRVHRVMSGRGTVLIPGRVDAVEPDEQKPGLSFPIFEAEHEQTVIRFRGQSAKNAGGFTVGDAVKLYYNKQAGTAVEGSALGASRFVGITVSIVGVVTLALSVLLYSRW